MRYCLLGPLEVLGDDGSPLVLSGQRERALVAVLVLNANRAVSPARLVDALWGEEPPATATNALQVRVSKLRKKLAAASTRKDLLRSVPAGYVLEVGPGELDLDRFEGLTAGSGGGQAELSRRLGEALALWRGPALAGVDTDVLAGDAARLEESRMVALERRIDADLALGRHHGLVPELEALVRANPLREGLRGQLMVALYRAGRQAGALAVYRQGRAVLAEELGIDPGPALQALEVAVLQQSPEIAVPSAAKAGPRAERAELTRATERRGHNLPRALSNFVGREAETGVLGQLIDAHRLAVVVGTGGVGKTRLALEVAGALTDRFDEGVWLVELASLRNPNLVVDVVAEALGVPEQPGRPLLESIVDALGQKRPLVVLDNCEHLAAACARVVESLLRGCPGVHVLATSREPLGVDDEQVFRLAPLPTPVLYDRELGAEEAAASDAVQLFVERASAQRPGFALDDANAGAVASICQQLDGLPLALELAAARLRSMSVFDIEARLAGRFSLLSGGRRTAPARHQTLQALIDWSYEMLASPEQAVLRRLSIFAGGWRLDQAEQVCTGGELTRDEVAGHLGALVDRSLVEMEPTGKVARYRLLETVRQYASERLAKSGEAEAVAKSHALAYLELAEVATPHLIGPAQAQWLARLDEDLGNLRVAAATLLGAGDGAEEALRLVAAQRWYWDVRARYREDIELAEAVLSLPAAQAPSRFRAQALLTLLSQKRWTGELAMDLARVEEGLAMARSHSDTPTTVGFLWLSAFGAYFQGDSSNPAVRAMANEAIEMARQSGDPHLLGRALAVAVGGGTDKGFARECREQAVALFRASGDRFWLSQALNNLADNEIASGDLADARAHLQEGIGIAAWLMGDSAMLSLMYANSGLAAVLQGDLASACVSYSDAFAVAERAGSRHIQAYSIFGLALCASAEGQARQAASLHGISQGLFGQLGHVLSPTEAGPAERDWRKLREELGPDTFEEVFASGRQLATSWWQVDRQARAAAIFAPQPLG
jgi:predicted ATPase/DNA-binding SARP family transcriptional activator